MHSEIPIRWKDEAGKLSIGARVGDFAGMTRRRSFHVVFVTEGHGAGPAVRSTFDREVAYNGEAVTVTAR
jgi:alpha-D-xyloside xylohydrolase